MRIENGLINGIEKSFDNLNRAVVDINKDLTEKANSGNTKKEAALHKAVDLVNDVTNIATSKQQENADVAALKVTEQMKGSLLNIIV